jgi:hypothetical protein
MMDVVTAGVLMAAIAATGGYVVGNGSADAGTALTIGTFVILIVAAAAGAVFSAGGDPLLESIGAVLGLYGVPGLVGLAIGAMAGHEIGSRESRR